MNYAPQSFTPSSENLQSPIPRVTDVARSTLDESTGSGVLKPLLHPSFP